MAQEGKDEVLFIVRDRLYLYDGGAILSLEFPPSLVHDVDVINRDELYNLVVKFIQDNKLLPAQLYVVLSESVCFSRDFTGPDISDPSKVDSEAKEFIDAIPFSSVVSKIYKTANTVRVVGSNEDFINTIFDAFENKGFGVSTLVPSNIFTEFGVSNDLTSDKAQLILDKKAMAVSASMIGEKMVKDQALATSQTAKPKNKMLPYLIAVFTVLGLV